MRFFGAKFNLLIVKLEIILYICLNGIMNDYYKIIGETNKIQLTDNYEQS